MVPAMAVPSDEPRLDTLRDNPEISPCCSSGKADCTTLTDGLSITPRPRTAAGWYAAQRRGGFTRFGWCRLTGTLLSLGLAGARPRRRQGGVGGAVGGPPWGATRRLPSMG